MREQPCQGQGWRLLGWVGGGCCDWGWGLKGFVGRVCGLKGAVRRELVRVAVWVVVVWKMGLGWLM